MNANEREFRRRSIAIAVLPLVILAILSIVPTPAHAEGWAIVIGVNAYPSFRLPDGSQPRALRGAEADADAMSSALTHQLGIARKKVLLLKGKDATYTRTRDAFAAIRKQAGPDDFFVFHFSGHGTQIPDRKPFDEPDQLDEALVLADSTERGENLVVDDELGLWLDDLPMRNVTVILDCCHAGTGTKGDDDEFVARYLPMPQTFERREGPKEPWRDLRSAAKGGDRRLVAFFACKPDQQAYERRFANGKGSERAGQFTQALLAGLKDDAADTDRDGKVTNEELLRYTANRLDSTFNKSREKPADRQEPLLETDDAQAGVFFLKREQPP